MKKLPYLMATALLLAACGGGNQSLKNVSLIGVDEDSKPTQIGTLAFRFFENPEVPFLAVEDFFALASATNPLPDNEEPRYVTSLKDGLVTVTEASGATASFNLAKQTIVFSDFDAFFRGNGAGEYPNSLGTPTAKTKSYRIVASESRYEKGAPVTLDFNPYPTLAIKEHEGTVYLPFCIYNDLFQGGANGLVTFAYNFKDAYLAPAGMRDLGKGSLTALGVKYFDEAPKKATVSKELAAFAYDQTLFGLDYFYGLKQIRGIQSFRAFVQEKGLENDMLSGDLAKMQDAYGTLLLKCLEDGHTAPLTPSPLTDVEDFAVKDSWRSEKQLAKEKEDKAFRDARVQKKATKPFEVVGNTAFIYFDDFVDLDESVLYGALTEKVIRENNSALFAYAYQQIQADPKIKNVVVDLATNNGGDAEGLIYCLGTLLGKFHLDSGNPLSKSHTRMTFETDINVDGKIDEKDVPLCKDHAIYMLDSKFAFSCGNLFPVAARLNSDKVFCIGDRTGGGTCSVKNTVSALGDTYVSSSLNMILKEEKGAYVHIEDGAPIDIPWAYEKMFDRADIVSRLGQ